MAAVQTPGAATIMTTHLRKKLIFHGAIVILLGLLAGFPFAMVLLGSMHGEVRAWRMAHLEGVLNGLLVIAVAGIGRRLELDERQQRLLAWSLIVMAYGNVVASTIGATFGVRGLSPQGPAVNLLVYVLFMVAVVAIFVAMGLVAWGARAQAKDLRDRSSRRAEQPPAAPTASLATETSEIDPDRPRRRRRRRGRGRGRGGERSGERSGEREREREE